MPEFKIEFTVVRKGARAERIKNEIEDVLGRAISIRKVNANPGRSERLAEAEAKIEDAKSIITDLQQEIQDWYDNLPEGFQTGDKGDRLQECADSLQSLIDDLENVDFGSVEFPGMY
jgi:hypothetical protein